MSEHHSYQGYSTEYMIRKDGETYRDSREKEKGRKTERERERTEAKDFQQYHEKYCEYWRETSSQKDA